MIQLKLLALVQSLIKKNSRKINGKSTLFTKANTCLGTSTLTVTVEYALKNSGKRKINSNYLTYSLTVSKRNSKYFNPMSKMKSILMYSLLNKSIINLDTIN